MQTELIVEFTEVGVKQLQKFAHMPMLLHRYDTTVYIELLVDSISLLCIKPCSIANQVSASGRRDALNKVFGARKHPAEQYKVFLEILSDTKVKVTTICKVNAVSKALKHDKAQVSRTKDKHWLLALLTFGKQENNS